MYNKVSVLKGQLNLNSILEYPAEDNWNLEEDEEGK